MADKSTIPHAPMSVGVWASDENEQSLSFGSIVGRPLLLSGAGVDRRF